MKILLISLLMCIHTFAAEAYEEFFCRIWHISKTEQLDAFGPVLNAIYIDGTLHGTISMIVYMADIQSYTAELGSSTRSVVVKSNHWGVPIKETTATATSNKGKRYSYEDGADKYPYYYTLGVDHFSIQLSQNELNAARFRDDKNSRCINIGWHSL